MTAATGDELHHQILANADTDDTTRLVYADWLEECGELARADLIRAQCTAAGAPSWERRTTEAAWRADALLAEYGAAWRRALPKIDGVEWTRFDRGFVSTVRVRDVKTLYRHARAIAAAAPVSRVEITKLDESVTPWVEDSVPWLRTLVLGGERHTVHRGSSITSAVEHLEVVDLADFDALEWLAHRTPEVPLRSLVVEGMHTAGLPFAQTVAAHLAHDGLRVLHIGTRFVDYDTGYYSDPTLRRDGALALATAKLGGVEQLDIDRQRVGNEGFAAMIERMPKVTDLSARGCELTDLAVLRKPGALLSTLDLSANNIGPVGAEQLAASPRTAALAALALDTCEIDARGVAALVAAPMWRSLRVLDLSRNPLGAAAVAALAAAPRPEHLHTLRLADTDLDGAALAQLVAIPWLRDLLELDLSGNDLGAAVAELRVLAAGAKRPPYDAPGLGRSEAASSATPADRAAGAKRPPYDAPGLGRSEDTSSATPADRAGLRKLGLARVGLAAAGA
ncbi:MAG: TIGR02996 domain-containing protein, partial [Deltaproteobacteria bacterium]|nr:TIGR02996 domain-containing protein [Deltaproteobacteria bacterium]